MHRPFIKVKLNFIQICIFKFKVFILYPLRMATVYFPGEICEHFNGRWLMSSKVNGRAKRPQRLFTGERRFVLARPILLGS